MDTQPKHDAPFRCFSIDVAPFRKALSSPVRPERREQAVHPAAKLGVQPAHEVEGHPPQLRRKTTNPKLNSYANAASKTTQGHPKTPPSYDAGRPSTLQSASNHPQNGHSQLRRETNKTKLNSYANAANETTSSYENPVSSYGSGRTPICKSPRTRPKTALQQLRHETTNPYLNSYRNAAGKTADVGSKRPCGILACVKPRQQEEAP